VRRHSSRTPVAHDHNTAFSEAFGAIDEPTTLEHVLDRFDITPLEDGADLSAAISRPNPPIVPVGGGRLRTTVPDPPGFNRVERDGQLSFVRGHGRDRRRGGSV